MSTNGTPSLLTVVATVLVASISNPTASTPQFGVASVCSLGARHDVEVKAEPAVAVSPWDTLFVVWQDLRNGTGGQILGNRTAKSGTDGFGIPSILNDDPTQAPRDRSSEHSAPTVAIGPDGTVYVAWTDRRSALGSICPGQDGGCLTDVFMTRSSDGGITFSENVRLNDVSEHNQSDPMLAIDELGRLHAVWRDSRDGGGTSDVYYSQSDDGGLSWTPSRNLVEGTDELQIEPDLAVSGDVVYVVWADRRDGQYDIYLTKSVDRGATFERNYRVHDLQPDVQHRAPSVAVAPDGGALVVWQDFRDGYADADVYFAHNPGGLAERGVPIRINDDVEPAVQAQPRIVVDGSGYPVVAWRDYRNGSTDPDIYLTRARSASPPYEFEPNVRVNQDDGPSSQARPALAVSPSTGEVVIAWEHHRPEDGGVDIVVARGGP